MHLPAWAILLILGFALVGLYAAATEQPSCHAPEWAQREGVKSCD